MHILWLCQSASESESIHAQLRETVPSLLDEGIYSTLLYRDLSSADHKFLQTFNAAFPHVLLEQQISAIKPDLICTCYPMDKKFSIPLLTFHPNETKEIIRTRLTRISHTISHKDERDVGPDLYEKSGLTVVIRTKNSVPTIEQTLKALYSQNISPKNVVVIDSESKDHTLDIVRSYGITHIRSIGKEEYFPGKVLNHMMEDIFSEIVVFLNSDAVLLTPSSLQFLLEPLQNKNIVGAFARQIARPDADPWVVRDYESSYPPKQPAPEWLPFSLCFAAIHRKAWEEHPFYLDAWGSEDVEWAVWAKKAGYEIAYIPEAIVMHSHNYTCKQLYGRRFIEGEADAFIYQREKTFIQTLFSFMKSVVKDVIFYIRKLRICDMHQIIPIRFVYHWGYYRGNKWGMWRKRNQNTDTSLGQKEVLNRYDRL